MLQSTQTILQNFFDGDKRALARLITYVENRHEDLLDLMRVVSQKLKNTKTIGVTGPPGAGKSTLVDKLIRLARAQQLRVGVLAIDPSSPFSGGAVLGDRIRMQEHSADAGVFIRSVGSRGAHGGLSRATHDMVTLMDAFGFDLILIETVGVGQTELDIMAIADTTVVVLVPESGDTIQTMKAGLMEIADVFVVNKADREGADKIFHELAMLSHLYSTDWQVPVLQTTATKNDGITELYQAIEAHAAFLKTHPEKKIATQTVWQQRCLAIVWDELRPKLADKMTTDVNANLYQTAMTLLQRIKL